MALRKPLVMIAGQIQQLPVGDELDATTAGQSTTLTNDNASPISKCQPVYCSSSGGCDLADASAGATHGVIGLVDEDSILSGAAGSIRTNGVLEATVPQWDFVTGQSGGLTPCARYFLATLPGVLTTVAPTVVGEYVVYTMRALTPTKALIEIAQSVLL